MSSSIQRRPTAEPIVIGHAAEDLVWAQWLRQVIQDAGGEARGVVIDSAEPCDLGAGGSLVLVISEYLMRIMGRSIMDRHASADRTVIAVITGTGEPQERTSVTVDLRAQPDADSARHRVWRALGFADPGQTAGHPRGAVRYPGGQLFAEYPPAVSAAFDSRWFFGRDREIGEIRSALDDVGAAVLCGPAGRGKTWLAKSYLHRFGSQYDLIAWIPGDSGPLMRAELSKLAQDLLPNPNPHPRLYLEVVAALESTDKRYLIVYDDVTPDAMRMNATYSLARKPALLSEVVPWQGGGHVILTSRESNWPARRTISLPSFTVAEGSRYLRRHGRQLPEEKAREYTHGLRGYPLTLNMLARKVSRASGSIDDELFEQMREVGDSLFVRTRSVVGGLLSPLLEADRDSDQWAAGFLLRLLAAFPPDLPIALALLTSELGSGEPGRRLPEEVAAVLADPERCERVLDLMTAGSIAQRGADPLTDSGEALIVHEMWRNGLRDVLPKEVAATNRHRVHRMLCDANPGRDDEPRHWERFGSLWRMLDEVRVFDCEYVADTDDPCSALPELIWNVIGALRNQGEVTAAVGLGTDAVRRWSPVLGADNIWMVRIQAATGKAAWQLGNPVIAQRFAQAALDGVRPHRTEFPADYVLAEDLMAAMLRIRGEWAAAVPMDEDAVAWARDHLGDNHIETVRAVHNLAVAYRIMGRFDDAMKLDAGNHKAISRGLVHPVDQLLALHCLNNCARNHRELGRYQESVVLQRQVVERFAGLLKNPLHQHLLRARKNLAVSLHREGEYAEALVVQRAALDDHVRVYGEGHPESIAARTNVANCFRTAADPGSALEYARKAWELCEGLPERHPFGAACAVNYAAAVRAWSYAQADTAEAAELGVRALALDDWAVEAFTGRLGHRHPYTLAALRGRADDLAMLGRSEEAVTLGSVVLDAFRAVRGADHPYTLQSAVNHLLDLRAVGRAEEAAVLAADTLERYASTLGADHPDSRAAAAGTRGTCDVEPPPM